MSKGKNFMMLEIEDLYRRLRIDAGVGVNNEMNSVEKDIPQDDVRYNEVMNQNALNVGRNYHYEDIYQNEIPSEGNIRDYPMSRGGETSNRPNINLSQQHRENMNFQKRPFSEKNPDKEYKKRQQEEYRKALENQIREQNERKNRAKLESRGIEVKNVHTQPHSQQPHVHNQQPVQHIQQPINQYVNQPHHQTISQPHGNLNINVNSPNIINPTSSNKVSGDANNERKKKLEYQNFLKQQMEDKRQRQFEEKKKRLSDDIKYIEKFSGNEENNTNKKKKPVREENNTVSNGPVINNSPYEKIPSNNNITTYNNNQQIPINSNRVDIYNPPNKEVGLSQDYNNFKDRFTRTDKVPDNTFITSQNYNTMGVNANYHYKENIYYDDGGLSNYQQDIQGDPQLMNYNMNQNKHNNQNMTMPSRTTPPQNQQYMVPPIFEEMLRQFFQEQMKLVNQYKDTIDKMNDERDKAMFQNIAAREKMVAVNSLKNNEEKIKDSLGFLPFGTNYNKRIEDMLNIIDNNASNRNIIDKKEDIKSIERLNTVNTIDDDRPLKGIQNEDQADYYDKLAKLDYKSKYENDLSQSMMSINIEITKSLQGFSKLVRIDPGNERDKFLETWREISNIDDKANDFNDNEEDHTSTYGHNYNSNHQLFSYNYPTIDEKYNQKLLSNNQMHERHNHRAKSASVFKAKPNDFFSSQQGIRISAMENNKSLCLEETERKDEANEIIFDNNEYEESCNQLNMSQGEYEYENSHFIVENELTGINEDKEQYYNRNIDITNSSS
jgi:hypothetical protein